MMTEWHATTLQTSPKGMMEVHHCSACPSRCRLVLPLSEEPPKICLKESKEQSRSEYDLTIHHIDGNGRHNQEKNWL